MTDPAPLTLGETASINAILTHVSGILSALPLERYEATMQARVREFSAVHPGEDHDELATARENRVIQLRWAAECARKLVLAAERAQEEWRHAVRLTTQRAGTREPITFNAFDAEGMPAADGHLVTLPSGKQVFQLDEPRLEPGGQLAGNPTVVEPGGRVLYPKFGRVVAGVPDGA